jgi:hypothetical protein
MVSKRTEGKPVPDSSIAAPASSDNAELNLYDDLMAFTVLTPEQQGEMLARCAETEQEEQATGNEPIVVSSTPIISDSPPPAAPSSPTARATISIYKTPDRTTAGARSSQVFIVLDADELLSDESILSDESLDDLELCEADGECAECGSAITSGEVFCPSCGCVLSDN